MDRTELGKITRIRTGKLDANAADDGGMYPFFTCAEKPLAINTAAYDCECVLVAGNGDLNVKYYKGKFNAYQRTYIVESSDSAQLQVPYLYRFLEHYVHNLRSQSIGGVIKYIRLSNLTDALIPLLSTAEQQQVTDCFDKIDELVSVCQRALDLLDLLVKSRFIEMFGNPDNNPNGYPMRRLGDAVSIERGGSPRPISQYVTSGEDGVNWIKIGDTSEDSIYISKTEEKITRAGMKKSRYVQPGDFLLSNSMSFGRPYILKTDGCIHDGWLVLRDSSNAFDKMYLYALLDSEYAKRFFAKKAVGTTVRNLNKEIVGNMPVLLPPPEKQIEYADFFIEVDKLRFDVQQQIEKLQMLKKSLMQEYFG